MNKKKKSYMYISYDGLLDPLGASQILPYLKDIVHHSNSLVIISFEKKERLISDHKDVFNDLKTYNIHWRPIRFTKNLGFLGKSWDLIKMCFWGFFLAIKFRVEIVHARAHPSALIGLLLKKLLGTKLLFDFRGLWADERVDKGGWDLSLSFHKIQYNFFKKKEQQLLAQSDQIVVLTNKVVSEIMRLGAKQSSKITVIPSCADFDHFYLSTNTYRSKSRASLGIPKDAVVLGYLGSIGKMYMLDSFFRLFKSAVKCNANCYALLITHDISKLNQIMNNYLPTILRPRVYINSASRNEVPHVIQAMTVLVSFIQPSYARMAASPTKVAECFAAGIPIICNDGTGDVSNTVQQLRAGIIIDPSSEDDLLKTVNRLDKISAMGGRRLRDTAREKLGLEFAFKSYRSVYTKLN